MSLAPIVVFGYNRPEHLQRCLESLSANALAPESELFIFCDGAKSAAERTQVAETRRVARLSKWCGRVQVEESDVNRGLSASISRGVTRICRELGRAIVIEDDLILSPIFLEYMNASLEKYAGHPAVRQISGYMFPLDFGGAPRGFFLPLTTSWGWATWQRAWADFSNDPRHVRPEEMDAETLHRFDLVGRYDYSRMLRARLEGRNDSWAILWWWKVFRDGGLVLHPSQSLVANIGFDGTGTHCDDSEKKQTEPPELCRKMPVLPDLPVVDAAAFELVKKHLGDRQKHVTALKKEAKNAASKKKKQRVKKTWFWRALDPLLAKIAEKVTPPEPPKIKREPLCATIAATAKMHPECVIRNLLGNPAAIVVGAGTHIRGELLTFWNAGRVQIGECSYIGESSRIWSQNSVIIGDYVLIAHLVDIHDTDSHPVDWQARRADTARILRGEPYPAKPEVASAPVVIEDDVWIGFKASILKGVRVGRGAIVAAGTVVTKDVAPWTLVAGNPAREIRSLR